MPKSKRRKRSARSKTGFFGVTIATSGRFQAKIRINGKWKWLGTYDTAKQAAKAYDKEAIKLLRPLFKLNCPKKAPVGYTPIQQPLLSRNTVGYRGVSKEYKKFRAQTRIAGKLTRIGIFETAKEAAVAYDRVVLKYNQCTSLLNFPGMVHNLDVEPKRKKQKRANNTTGYRGVSKQKKSYMMQISIDGKRTRIGPFDTAVAAALAYDQAAIKAGKKKSTLNFPDELPIRKQARIFPPHP